MPKILQFRRGNTTEISAITGSIGELFVDTTKDTVVVMDGVTLGGKPLATETYVNTQVTGLATETYVNTQVTGLATETYVNTQVANVVNSAPTTLNTLNELAAALGNDANYTTTVATALGLKANISSLAVVATSGSYTDLLNKPTIPVVGTDVQAYDSNLTNFVTTFTLPTTDGTNGQVVSTNGSGTLSFSTLPEQSYIQEINTMADTAYTFVLADHKKVVVCTSSSNVTLTIPPESSVAWQNGSILTIVQSGTGLVEVVAGSGVTLNTQGNSGARKIRYQHQIASVFKTATDTWMITGDLVI